MRHRIGRLRQPQRLALLLAAVTVAGSATACSEPASRQGSRSYPPHTDIVATTFWVGEVFDPAVPDGSQVCSSYDSQWAFHWSGVARGAVPDSAEGCAGARTGGCDGVAHPGSASCDTEKRVAENDFFPSSGITPRENPFYLDLPYDDLNDPIGFAKRCETIPWANDPGYTGRCDDRGFSYMKNRWVAITGPNGRTCYGQIEDAGPSHDGLYHDAGYVLGDEDARPAQKAFNNAGMDVSPALNGCLGFSERNGQEDRVTWRFVDDANVPDGPWLRVVTRSGVTL
ncbi:hypothetical protein [Streptomyces sp. NPDC058045]|uniref:hypothetical protein n=1 Tax=Streptomyces sp. NPDC058045 TaxID=3346311 RepID=UPI0036EE8FFF